VANLKFYGFKVYSKAIYSTNATDGVGCYFDGGSVGELTNAMRTFKAALSVAFGGTNTSD
jgi:hypothetical protein